MKSLIVEICVGTSCLLLGSQDLFEAVAALPLDKRERVDLREVACFQSCRQGPNVRMKGVLLSGMTPNRLVGMIEENLA